MSIVPTDSGELKDRNPNLAGLDMDSVLGCPDCQMTGIVWIQIKAGLGRYDYCDCQWGKQREERESGRDE